MFRIAASLGALLFAETLQQRVVANVRMPLAGLVLIEKKMVILFPYLQGLQLFLKAFLKLYTAHVRDCIESSLMHRV